MPLTRLTSASDEEFARGEDYPAAVSWLQVFAESQPFETTDWANIKRAARYFTR